MTTDNKCGPLELAKDWGDYVRTCEHIRAAVARAHAAIPSERIPHWVVLGPGTIDHPGVYVARLWVALPELGYVDIVLRANSLLELRDLLPAGLSRLDRQDGDDPNIIEAWL